MGEVVTSPKIWYRWLWSVYGWPVSASDLMVYFHLSIGSPWSSVTKHPYISGGERLTVVSVGPSFINLAHSKWEEFNETNQNCDASSCKHDVNNQSLLFWSVNIASDNIVTWCSITLVLFFFGLTQNLNSGKMYGESSLGIPLDFIVEKFIESVPGITKVNEYTWK